MTVLSSPPRGETLRVTATGTPRGVACARRFVSTRRLLRTAASRRSSAAAIGASYQVDEDISVDLSYMRVFIAEADIDLESETGQRLKGDFEGSADVFGIQVNVFFW